MRKQNKMTSIFESTQGLNGDGWGTTISKADQLAHKEFAKQLGNFGLDREREREMDEMRTKMRVPTGNRNENLSGLKTSFISDLLPKQNHYQDGDLNIDTEAIDEQFDKIKSKHTDDINKLLIKLNVMSVLISDLSSRISVLETEVKKLRKPGFFGRLYNRLFG